MQNNTLNIDIDLVRYLITTQFPQWKNLPIRSVSRSGWDNRTFHLGDRMLVRLPSAPVYAVQVEKEHRWLPILAPLLPVQIPVPLAMGEPGGGYPCRWSIYQWIEGESAATASIKDMDSLAISLAQFLTAFERIDSTDGPLPGLHSFHRGGSLKHYDEEMKRAIAVLNKKIDTAPAVELWNHALKNEWTRPPVWVHGDISAGNLLIKDGELCAVIDFGQLTIGDPACDLAIAWTLFKGETRQIFMDHLSFDSATWIRAKAWTLWKAFIVAAGFTNPSNAESEQCWRIIDDILKK